MRPPASLANKSASVLLALGLCAAFTQAPLALAQTAPDAGGPPTCAIDPTGGASPLPPSDQTAVTMNGKPLYSDAPVSYNLGVNPPPGCPGDLVLPPDSQGGGPNMSNT